MDWTKLLTSRIEATYRATDGLMKLVKKDDLDWKPKSGKNWMTTAQLLSHLTDACGWCIHAFATGDWTPPEAPATKKKSKASKATAPQTDPETGMPTAKSLPKVKSVAEARKKLAADMQVALDTIREAGEDALENRLSAAPWEPGVEKPLGLHALEMVGHLAQHKAQLFYYLKLQGKPVNTLNLYGMK